MKEGEVTDIKIEVSAEDGTIKNYWVHVKRLSAKDATLSDLQVKPGVFSIPFAPELYEYDCKFRDLLLAYQLP